MKLTVYEATAIRTVVNSPGGNATISDLRLSKSVIDLVEKATPPPPQAPAGLPADATDEQKAAQKEEAKAFLKEMQAYGDIEVDIAFSSAQLDLARRKVSQFGGFYDDEKSRNIVLGLADKLGIK